LTASGSPRRRRAFDLSTAIIAAVAVGAAALVYWRDGDAQFREILESDFALLGGMVPRVLAGCLIGTFVTLVLPREVVARWVGHESGLAGLAVGAFFGIGADVGAVVAFVTSWTLVGYTRALVWELPFFGGHFVIWRIIEALPLPIIAGLLARMTVQAGLARIGGRR
jgi:hypothetical protein